MPKLSSLFDLGGRVALITGGSRGLGLQIADALGQYGGRIALAARKQAELDEAVQLLAAAGIPARGYVADLAAEDAAEALVAAVMNDHGRIDVLVNNAGATWGAPAEDYPLSGWHKVMDLNVTGAFLLTQAVARRAFLPQGKGAVINLASTEGLQGHHPERVGTIAYNTSKGALINMTRALAAEWGSKNIRVNAIAPGFFPTRMATSTLAEHGASFIANTPLGKLGGETDLMGPALLLASDAGGHITGQVIVVDGGATII